MELANLNLVIRLQGHSPWNCLVFLSLLTIDYFQLPLFRAIICVIHLPFFSIRPCKWSLHIRQMCCRPEFPTNYRLEIRTIKAYPNGKCLDRPLERQAPWLKGRTWVGLRYLFAWKTLSSTAEIPKLLSQARQILVWDRQEEVYLST